jgi:cell division protein FtsQ
MAVRGNRTSRRKPKRLPVRLFLIPAAVAAVWLAWPHINVDTSRIRNALPVEYVRVEGSLWNLDPEEFRTVVMPHAQTGYFMLDLKVVEAAVSTLAWVDHVEAARIWPDTVVLRVVEQQPVARWGEHGLLNVRGASFTPANAAAFTRLPQLAGPPGREKEVLGMMRALNLKLKARQLRVETLRLSKRLAWEAQLEGGMEIVYGNQDPLAATDRLLALLPQLGEERIASIRKLDLRYPNGFSVVWKPENPTPPEQSGTG